MLYTNPQTDSTISTTPVPCVISRTKYKVASAVIWVEIHGTDTHVHGIVIDHDKGRLARKEQLRATTALAKRAHKELVAYFRDPIYHIDLPLWSHEDSANQAAAMSFLRAIPCGQTRSYAQQASAVREVRGNGFNARNAGNANRNNHYPLVIPCHRVVRADGDVGGFMGSIAPRARSLKQALLGHEKANVDLI